MADKGTELESIVRFGIEGEFHVAPVFDPLRKVFIVTLGRDSFYVDIDGNHDRTCGS